MLIYVDFAIAIRYNDLYENMEDIAVRMIPECIGVWYGCSFYSEKGVTWKNFKHQIFPSLPEFRNW